MSYLSEVLADSPNLFLRLGETSGTNANDETSNNADGTYIGGFTLNQTGPISGDPGAVQFDGTSGYVALGNPSAVQVSGQFTIEAWFYLNGWPSADNFSNDNTYFNIAGKGYNGTNEGYILRFQNYGGNKRLHCGSYDGADHGVTYDASSFTLNTWYHVAAKYNGTHWVMFVNGAQVASSASGTGALSSTGNFYIGATVLSGTPRRFLNGRVVNVALYSTALPDSRIAVHYAQASGGGSLTSGTASVSATGTTTATVNSTDASGGASPYTYQWHRSTTSGFTPSGGTAVSGATARTLNDTGLTASTTYYYKLVFTDSAAASVTSNQVSLTTSAAGSPPTIMGGSISTDGTQVTVNFSETVSSVTTAGFFFIVDGYPLAPSAVSGSGASRVFEIGKRWVPKGSTVTITYDSSLGDVVDASAEELASVSGISVSNSSTVNVGAAQHIGGRISMFLHWGMNTFANQEWTDGSRSMSLFNPTDLNFSQWAKAAKLMGAESMIWTAMHHDGFKNWRSATGTYGLVQSPWGIANPTRDLVKEYADACRAAGLRVSLYYSVWNRKDGQNTASVIADLTELLTKYGTIDTIWTDGWGWNIGYTNVDFDLVQSAVKAIQPNCQIVENNHQGDLQKTDIISKENFYDGIVSSDNRLPTQFTQTIWGVPTGSPDQFVPGEWWFHHEPGTPGWSGVPVAASTLVTNINLCLARRANYSLNVSPDTTGKITDIQLRRLAEVGALLSTVPPSNYAIPSPSSGGSNGGGNIIAGLI